MLTKKIIKKTMLGFAVSAITFTSCQKELDQQLTPNPQPQPVLQLTEFKSGDDATRFQYNADGTVRTIQLDNDPVTQDNNVTYTVKYLPNKKIEELNGNNDSKIKLSYSASGLLVKAEIFISTIKVGQTDYSYSGNQIRSSTISWVDNNTPVPFLKSDFTFNSNNNISRANSFMYNPLTNSLEASGHVLQQYDDKRNPFADLGDIILVFWQATSKNNVTKQEYFNKSGGAEEVIETTYTYNSQGYPTRATMRETAPGQPVSTATITYTYR